ncbi:MAG TPA: hypothetical protein VIU62_01245, partial [Chloroflexota bacterium]
MVLPAFTAEGVLPPGDYPLTVQQLRASFLITGEEVASPGWDGEWRASSSTTWRCSSPNYGRWVST